MTSYQTCSRCKNQKWCLCKKMEKCTFEGLNICMCCYSEHQKRVASQHETSERVRSEMKETFQFIHKQYSVVLNIPKHKKS